MSAKSLADHIGGYPLVAGARASASACGQQGLGAARHPPWRFGVVAGVGRPFGCGLRAGLGHQRLMVSSGAPAATVYRVRWCEPGKEARL